MNIGTITQNASGTYTGKISTLTVAIVIALRTVQSANPKAPKFEILALFSVADVPRPEAKGVIEQLHSRQFGIRTVMLTGDNVGAATHVAGLTGIDAQTGVRAALLPKDKIIYCHCLVGGRCLEAARLLQPLGYDVRPLKAGYPSLVKAGFPAVVGQ